MSVCIAYTSGDCLLILQGKQMRRLACQVCVEDANCFSINATDVAEQCSCCGGCGRFVAVWLD